MEIFTINVGQGACVVVRDEREAVVIDTRIPAVADRRSEYLKGALTVCLKDRNVRGLILTGFDRDHADAAGTALVLRKYRPDWVMYPKYFKDTDSARDVFSVIRAVERERRLEKYPIRLDLVDSRFYSAGQLCSNIGFELFSPHPEDMTSSNDCSLVAKLTDNRLSYLVTGDCEETRWDTIARLFRGALKSDVMAAPHHGSRNGVHVEALMHIRPHTILISAGPGNSYGHPHSEALMTYGMCSAEVRSTHDEGTLHTYLSPLGIRTEAGTLTRA